MKRPRRRASVHWLWLGIPLVLAVLAAYVWLRILGEEQALASDSGVVAAESSVQPGSSNDTASAPEPPRLLEQQVAALGEAFGGDVGIIVQPAGGGWSAEFNGDMVLPQQSLSKLWVAAAILDRVDRGELTLDQQLTLTSADLSIFHQPIRKQILAAGRYQVSIAELLRYAMTQSDNTANAVLFRQAGGQAGVMRFLASRGLSEIQMATSETDLQMGIAGMQWRSAYSYGRNFWTARAALPFDHRAKALGAYLADPPDGATPRGYAKGLGLLAQGKLLRPQTSAYLIGLMGQSKTGPQRLRGGLPPAAPGADPGLTPDAAGVAQSGWTLPHKTGTGQVLKQLATAYNDVGILTAPDGRRYILTVMIGSTNRSVKERQEMMQAVTRSVIACDEAGMCRS
ncbi:serine hydrolase [Sphingorhabdus arenilitoris]|uniref:beta-lactamase n=1 Tax=Sphingorhabdus arenilitoris TaxID=1490041 RepID=A0ABV8RHL7_9SPHN